MRRVHQVDGARVRHDQARTLADAALHLRAEHRMPVGGIGADHEYDVGLHHRVEVLRTGRLAESMFQAIAGGGMTDAGAGVDVVVAETGSHQLLHEVSFLVGAAG